MEVQPQLLLLQKTIFNIEGLGRDLYPDMNLWDKAKPFLESWVKKQRSPLKLLPKYFEQFENNLSQVTKPKVTSEIIVPVQKNNIKSLALIGTLTGLTGIFFSAEAQNLWLLSLTLIQALILWQK